jgi:RNA-directed DNA polymerase
MGDTLRSQTLSTTLQKIAQQAVQYPDVSFNSLAHLIDVDFLREAYHQVRKDSAPGIDGMTAKGYSKALERNLQRLHSRLRGGVYQAPPVERRWIDKDDGKQRPLGLPTFEDKIVQRAVAMLLGAVYEQEFHPCSHGFRPGHSPHQAVQEVRAQCTRRNIRWIVDADVSGFFDHLDHGHLRRFIKRRVNDGGILRLIGKWLNAGVLENGTVTYPTSGTPQGGVISPLLANIYLHYGLDEWFLKEVQPRLKGRGFLVRFADDCIIGCELESDARRILAVLPKRFVRFALTIHPTKTKLVEFRPPDGRHPSKADGEHTFDFLGFTHYWAKSRRGAWVIKRKTLRKRFRRCLKALWRWCRNSRHWGIREQYRILCSKLRGHYQYYAIRGSE